MLKPSTHLKALLAAATAAVGFASFGLAQGTSAVADPTTTYVGVGSDTTADVMDQFALDINNGGTNMVGSYDAVSTVTRTHNDIIEPVNGNKGVRCEFTRPDGSTQGLNALRKSISPSTSAPQLPVPPQQNCISFSRSSASPGTNQINTGVLVYIPFALDAMTGATGSASTLSGANVDQFTRAELIALYTLCTNVTVNGVTYNPNIAGPGQAQIHLYLPQSDSDSWNAYLAIPANLPACVHQTILVGPNTGQPVQQNDGTAVNSDPNGYMPFSVAQWIGQSNGHNDRRHGAVLHKINNTFPCANGNGIGIACPSSSGTLNTAFPITGEVYNVVRFDQVSPGGNFDPNLVNLLVGANSALCKDIFTITDWGFALLPTPQDPDACGLIANKLRANLP